MGIQRLWAQTTTTQSLRIRPRRRLQDRGGRDDDSRAGSRGHTDIIIANFPFSQFDAFLDKCIELEPRVMCLLFGGMNFTPNRINKLASAGYILVQQHQTWWRDIVGSLVIIAVRIS